MLQTVPPPKAQPVSTQPAELRAAQPEFERVAVLLNRNARRVSDRFARKVENVVGRDNLYYSRSLEEAEAFAREIVQRGYGTVVCGGGDGTLVRAVNLVRQYVEESNAWRMERYRRFGEVQSLLGVPRFAFLKLGTGNGMTDVVGARSPLDDLRRIVEFGPGRSHSLSTIDVGGDRCVIAGLGYDSIILNDYNWLKARTHSRLLKPMMHTVVGYFAALFARTLPRMALGRARKIEARVINRGRAFYIDPRRGDAAVEIPTGATLFEGPAAMIGVGTMPYFGFGFRIYPFANIMPGMMQLRITRTNPLTALSHVMSVWGGTYRNPNTLFDFLADDISVELEHPFPFQHSGDDQGMRDHLDLKVIPNDLELVDFYRPRPLT